MFFINLEFSSVLFVRYRLYSLTFLLIALFVSLFISAYSELWGSDSCIFFHSCCLFSINLIVFSDNLCLFLMSSSFQEASFADLGIFVWMLLYISWTSSARLFCPCSSLASSLALYISLFIFSALGFLGLAKYLLLQSSITTACTILWSVSNLRLVATCTMEIYRKRLER